MELVWVYFYQKFSSSQWTTNEVQRNQEGLDMNRINQVPVYVDVNLLGENTNTIKNNTQFLHTNKETGLQ